MSTVTDPLASKISEAPAGLRLWQHGAVFLCACLLLASRRPDAIFHAQFLQEDGHTWFADAYNLGWLAGVCRTYAGYFQVFPRLGAALALLVPLTLAPLVMNLLAIAIQALPVNLLLSARSSAWGSLKFRAILCAAYLALPDTREMLDNISQAQWILTLCAFLLLVARPPKTKTSRIFDLSILLLCGLTGPESVFLLPLALYLYWKTRNRWMLATAAVLGFTGAVQGWGLLYGGFADRPHAALGASVQLLARIVGGQIYLGTVLGGNSLAAVSRPGVAITVVCVAVAGTILAAICFAKSGEPLRLFVVLAGVMLAVSLLSPTAYPPAGESMWQLMAGVDGIRYWYLPSIAFVWLLLWGCREGGQVIRAVAAPVFCVMCFAIIFRWRIPAMPDLHFEQAARQFETAPAGTVLVLPENPTGWNIRLVKH